MSDPEWLAAKENTMGIKWQKAVFQDGRKTWADDGPETHVGLVVDTWTKHDVRVMSDVWADEFYAVVWDPEVEETKNISLGTNFENDCRSGRATVDLHPKVRAALDARSEYRKLLNSITSRQRRGESEEKEAKSRCLQPTFGKGEEVVVVKPYNPRNGDKVPVGTTGTVFWVGDGRCGINQPGTEDATWIPCDRVERVLPGIPPGQDPACGWVEYERRMVVVSKALRDMQPKRGSRVRDVDSQKEGYVYWLGEGAKAGRCGFKPDLKDRKQEGTYQNFDKLEIFLNGSWVKVPLSPGQVNSEKVARPVQDSLEAMRDAEEAVELGELDVKAKKLMREARLALNPLAEYPAPYNAVRSVEERNGTWQALDSQGTPILSLSADGAQKIIDILSSAA